VNRTSPSFRATWRTRSRSLATPSPALRPGRVSPAVFPSGRPLPSTTSAPAQAGLFGSFAGSTGLSDFPWSFIEGLPPQRSPHGPPDADPLPREPVGRGICRRPRATTGSPGSRAWSLSCVPGISDHAGSNNGSRKRRLGIAFRRWGGRRHPELHGLSWLNSPARTTPANASLRPHRAPTHDSGTP